MYVYGGKIASTNRITTIPMSMSFMRMREYWPLSAAFAQHFEPTLFYGICIEMCVCMHTYIHTYMF